MPIQIHLRLLPQSPMRTIILIWTQSLCFVSILILFYILFYKIFKSLVIYLSESILYSSYIFTHTFLFILIHNSFSLSLSILYAISPSVSLSSIPKRIYFNISLATTLSSLQYTKMILFYSIHINLYNTVSLYFLYFYDLILLQT